MALDFPSTPVTGDTYTPTAGNTYRFDGEKWVLAGTVNRTAANLRVGDTGIAITDTGANGNIVITADATTIAYAISTGFVAQDSLLTLVDDTDDTKKGKFELSGITTGTTRTINVPNLSGQLVTAAGSGTLSNKTLDNTNTLTIKEANFSIQDDADATKIFRLQLSGLTAAQTKTLTAPDGDSNILLLEVAQTVSNTTLANTSIISVLDANFTVQDNADATKQARFELSGLTTAQTKTFTLPDANTTLVGANATQTLTNKTITLTDANLSIIDNVDTTKIAKFEVSGITAGTTKTFTFPDANTTLVGTAIAQTLSNKTIDGTNNITIHDANLTLQDNVDATKIAKFELSGLTTAQTKTFTLPDANTTLVGANATQTLTNKTVTIQDANLSIIDNVDTTKIAKFEVSGITAGTTKTFTFPDANTTLVGTAIAQTLSNKTIDGTNNITIHDANLTLQDNADATKQVKFELSGITAGTTKTLTVVDANTTILGANITQTVSNKTVDNTNAITSKANLFTIQDQTTITKQAQFIASGITTGTTRSFTLFNGNTTLIGTDTIQTLTNKTINVINGNLTLQDNVDSTKQAKFELTNIATGTTKTFSFPDANTILVGIDTTQTLTNKTLDSAFLTGTTQFNDNTLFQARLVDQSIATEALGTLTGTGTTNVNIANANYFTVTMTSNTRTFAFINPPSTTLTTSFFMEITNGGLATITWPTGTNWPNGISPALTGSGIDILSFTTRDAGTSWRGAYAMKDSR